MSCHFGKQLTALRDGALTEAEARGVEAHLPGCPGCQSTLAELDRTLAALRTLPELPVGPPNTASLLSRLAREEPSRGRTRFFWLPAGGLALAASAAVVVVLAGRAGRDRNFKAFEAEPDGVAIAANYELLSDYEVVGLEQPDDVELVAHLNELERR